MSRIFKFGLLLALGVVPTSTAYAAHREEQHFQETSLQSGETFSPSLTCQGGSLLSGGYNLDQLPGNGLLFQVVGTYAQTDVSWRVDVKNVSSQPLSIGLSIVLICS